MGLSPYWLKLYRAWVDEHPAFAEGLDCRGVVGGVEGLDFFVGGVPGVYKPAVLDIESPEIIQQLVGVAEANGFEDVVVPEHVPRHCIPIHECTLPICHLDLQLQPFAGGLYLDSQLPRRSREVFLDLFFVAGVEVHGPDRGESAIFSPDCIQVGGEEGRG